jgi:hypothetical protein
MKSYITANLIIERPVAEAMAKGLREMISNLTWEMTQKIGYVGHGSTVPNETIVNIVAYSNQIEALHRLVQQISEDFEEEPDDEAIPF